MSANPPHGLPVDEVSESTELLRWLADERFTFLGYREYVLTAGPGGTGDDRLLAVPGTGLGILRADQAQGADAGRLPQKVSERARERQLLVVTKANSRSTVHRPAYLDYVGVKTFDAQGEVTGERRFLGLFTSAAYNESIQRIPVLRRKSHDVLVRSGFTANSHSGKDLLQILETYPRDELFQISVDDLERTVTAVLHLQERRQLRLFLRRDDYGRFMSCMVYLPRDRYTTQVRQAMEEILLDAFDGVSIDYTALVSESVLARLHFVVRVDADHEVPDVDPGEVEARLVDATRSWEDDFLDALVDSCGEQRADELAMTYAEAFPEGYKEDLSAGEAVHDLLRLEALEPGGPIDLSLYVPRGAAEGERRLKLYHVGEPVSLSLVLPRLQEMGVEVIDERPYRIDRFGRPTAWVYDFGLRYEPTGELPGDDARTLFQDAFAAVWAGQAESDGFNALVLRAGLTWRQAMVLRAYAKYLRQGGSTFSQDYIEECLRSNVHLARLLVRLFEARFDPSSSGGVGGSRRRAARGDRRGARRRGEPRPGPHPAIVPRGDPGDAAHELLPARRRRSTQAVRRVQARPAPGPRPAAAVAPLRDLGLQPARRGRAPALRSGRARWPALVGPPRGLPHRGARPGQGADGQERRHRAGRRQGRVRRQAPAAPTRSRPRGRARRGRRVLPDVHQRPARHHRQPRGRRRAHRGACRRPRWCATTATTPISSSPPTRAPRRSPTSPTRCRWTTGSGSATRSPPAARSATTTRRWASPPAVPGSR